METQSVKMIAYCDGGANPNPGPTGSGVHAYTYHHPVDKEKPTKLKDWYASSVGYRLLKEQSDAYPAVVVDTCYDFCIPSGMGTNNTAEIQAAIALLKYEKEFLNVEELHLICDSRMVVQAVEKWIESWKQRNWVSQENTAIRNVELWKELDELISDFKTRGRFSIAHTYGHTGDYGNTIADYNATIGITLTRKNLAPRWTVMSGEEYFSPEESIHPLLSMDRIYFSSDPDSFQEGVYYQATGSGKDFIFGKRSEEASFSVVCLDTADPIINSMMKRQLDRITDVNFVSYIKRESLRDARMMNYIQRYSGLALLEKPGNKNLYFLDKKPLVIEVMPGELPLRAIDSLTHLEEILNEFQMNFIQNGVFYEDGQMQYKLHDITEHFYESVTKRSGKNEIEEQRLRAEFGVGVKDTDAEVILDGVGYPVKLVFGCDVPDRNVMKRFEKLDPTIYLATWRFSDLMVRYAVIVKTVDALGIWCNYFSNNILLKPKKVTS